MVERPNSADRRSTVPCWCGATPRNCPPMASAFFHRCAAVCDADRSAPPGRGRSDRADVDDVRAGPAELEIGRYGESDVIPRKELDPERVMQTDQVLVGRNNTRRAYNMRIRQEQNIEEPLPVAGDKLVCLRNNRRRAVQRRAVAGEVARAVEIQERPCGVSPARNSGQKVTKVSVRGECFEGGIEAIPWEQRKPVTNRLRLCADRAQVAGLAMGRRRAVDESFVFQDLCAMAEHGITRAAKRLSSGGVTVIPGRCEASNPESRQFRVVLRTIRNDASRHFSATKKPPAGQRAVGKRLLLAVGGFPRHRRGRDPTAGAPRASAP